MRAQPKSEKTAIYQVMGDGKRTEEHLPLFPLWRYTPDNMEFFHNIDFEH